MKRLPIQYKVPSTKLTAIHRVNRKVVFCAAGVLSATPLTYSMRRHHSDVVVF
jgi:hypothetical protein